MSVMAMDQDEAADLRDALRDWALHDVKPQQVNDSWPVVNIIWTTTTQGPTVYERVQVSMSSSIAHASIKALLDLAEREGYHASLSVLGGAAWTFTKVMKPGGG